MCRQRVIVLTFEVTINILHRHTIQMEYAPNIINFWDSENLKHETLFNANVLIIITTHTSGSLSLPPTHSLSPYQWQCNNY